MVHIVAAALQAAQVVVRAAYWGYMLCLLVAPRIKLAVCAGIG